MAISSRLIPKTFAAPNTRGNQLSNVGTFSKQYDKRIHHQQGQEPRHRGCPQTIRQAFPKRLDADGALSFPFGADRFIRGYSRQEPVPLFQLQPWRGRHRFHHGEGEPDLHGGCDVYR